jgi:hypothetical protein
MAKFIERAERFDLNLPVRFYSSDGLEHGHCINVSETGMLIAFNAVVDVWLVGKLWLDLNGKQHILKAKTARVMGKEAGVAFLVESAADLDVIKQLVAYAREQQQPAITIGAM